MNSVGSIKIVLSVNEHPAVSVTVTEKDPAYKLFAIKVVSPFDQLYDNKPYPPVVIAEIVPFVSP